MKKLLALVILVGASIASSQTITTIQPTDLLSDSRAVINTNFSELNTYTMKNHVFNDLLMISTPGTSPASGYLRFYAKTGNQVCWKTSAGAESCTGSGTGDVVGPASATDSNFAGFDSTTGKLIKDSGSKAADFAVAAKGVTNGDTHDHAGGDGATIPLTTAVTGTLPIANGGTNQTTWTGGRCVQVNSGGTGLESAADACGTGGGGGSPASGDFTDFKASVSTDTVTIPTGRARIGNYAPVVIAQGTAKFTAGSGDVKVFIDASNNLVCHMATGIAATVGGSMVCSNVASPAYPANSIPIADLTVAPTTFYVTIDSDDRAFFSNKAISAGTGIVVTDSGGVATVAVDTATMMSLGGTQSPTGSFDWTGASGFTLNAETSGATLTTVSKAWFQAVNCTGTTAALNWDTIATLAPTAACTAGTTNTGLIRGLASFSNSEISQMQTHFALPSDWTGAVDLKFKWQTSATSGSVVWQAATVCIADAEVNDVAWNTASTVTDAAKGTTLQVNDASITGLTMDGCSAGEMAHLKVFRDPDHASDNLAATADLIGVEVTTRRAQ